VTAAFAGRLDAAGVEVVRFDTTPSKRRWRGPLGKVERRTPELRALLRFSKWLALAPGGRAKVYLAVNSDPGFILTVIAAGLLRLSRATHQILHYHSAEQVSRWRRRNRLLDLVVGEAS